MTIVDYFGPPDRRKEYERQIDAPTWLFCRHCDEQIKQGDMGTVRGGVACHYECEMRGIVGSSGHQRRKHHHCDDSCMDPPGLTRRQAAIHAVNVWEELLRKKHG